MFNQLIMNHSDLLGDLGDLVDVGGRSDLVDLGDLGVDPNRSSHHLEYKK